MGTKYNRLKSEKIMAAYFMYEIPFQHQLGVFFASFRCGCCVVLQNVLSREVTHVLRSIYACQLGARSVDLVFADELHVHLPDAMRRPFRGILPHALFALGPLLAEEVFQKAYHPVRPHDEHAELLTPPHGILCHAVDAVVATFKVGRGREVVVDEEADVVHAVCQEADISPSLALLPASIRKHVHPRRPALLSRQWHRSRPRAGSGPQFRRGRADGSRSREPCPPRQRSTSLSR